MLDPNGQRVLKPLDYGLTVLFSAWICRFASKCTLKLFFEFDRCKLNSDIEFSYGFVSPKYQEKNYDFQDPYHSWLFIGHLILTSKYFLTMLTSVKRDHKVWYSAGVTGQWKESEREKEKVSTKYCENV